MPTIPPVNTEERLEDIDATGRIARAERARQRGQGMAEYALIISLVVIALIITVGVIGHQTGNMYTNIENTFVGH